MKTFIELFSGSGNMTKAFKQAGYKTLSIDIEKKFNPDICKNILDLTINDLPNDFKNPTVIWASPPCPCFSVCTISKYWDKRLQPKSSQTYIALALVYKTIELIKELKPQFWFIENPRGILRKINFMQNLTRKTVTYCKYGDIRQKPTDIWNNCINWIPKKKCLPGDNCHQASPRGTKSGTQGLSNAFERSIIPFELCQEIAAACNNQNKMKQKLLKNG